MTSETLNTIDLGNDLLPDIIKALPETMATYFLWDP